MTGEDKLWQLILEAQLKRERDLEMLPEEIESLDDVSGSVENKLANQLRDEENE